jgi:hypothetical protein
VTFTEQMRAFSAKVKTQADQVVFRTVCYAAKVVILRSPYGAWNTWGPRWTRLRPLGGSFGYVPGHFVANWSYVEGYGSRAETSERHTETHESAVARVLASVVEADASRRIHAVLNPTSYGHKLEYGYSPQAPAGMVGITAMELPVAVMRFAKEVNK